MTLQKIDITDEKLGDSIIITPIGAPRCLTVYNNDDPDFLKEIESEGTLENNPFTPIGANGFTVGEPGYAENPYSAESKYFFPIQFYKIEGKLN